jgi:hypothetical protein
MTTTSTLEQQTDIRTLDAMEIDGVAGGLVSTIDVSGMPDRSEMCGTMWYMERLIKILTGQTRP